MSEDSIEQAAMREVQGRGGWGTQTTGVSLTGCPDYLGTYRGRALAWEFKVPGNYPTPIQRLRLRQAEKAGADAAVIRSRADAAARLDGIDQELDAQRAMSSVSGGLGHERGAAA